ncbi:MAG: DNA-processing protein DprA [Clostridia bacterium]|nr:DNA-processing protein DprA [Clostridia bacterium]
MDEKLLWMWLSLHYGAGTSIYQKLFNHFGSLDAIYDSDDADADLIEWLTPSLKNKLLDKNLSHAEEVLRWCDDHDVDVITPNSPEYPESLRLIDDYPAVLYCKGRLPDFSKSLCISVVGTRTMTVEGQRNAYELGYGLAKGGAIVVSGMAKGIDCTAQKGALYAGGTSVAVLGSGIDVCYPKENFALWTKLMNVGAVITEYPPHTPPNGSNFPVRNRIISALSPATVVVECDLNSGALITARKARKQGKMLFAYPGSVHEFRNAGTNQLLRDGAILTTGAIDVLEQFLDKYADIINLSASKEKPVINKFKKVASNYDTASFYNDNKKNEQSEVEEKKESFDKSQLTPDQLAIYDGMEFDKTYTVDDILQIGSNTNEIASLLMMLQLAGAIENVPGGYYIKK